jgi:hypothetical protein
MFAVLPMEFVFIAAKTQIKSKPLGLAIAKIAKTLVLLTILQNIIQSVIAVDVITL